MRNRIKIAMLCVLGLSTFGNVFASDNHKEDDFDTRIQCIDSGCRYQVIGAGVALAIVAFAGNQTRKHVNKIEKRVIDLENQDAKVQEFKDGTNAKVRELIGILENAMQELHGQKDVLKAKIAVDDSNKILIEKAINEIIAEFNALDDRLKNVTNQVNGNAEINNKFKNTVFKIFDDIDNRIVALGKDVKKIIDIDRANEELRKRPIPEGMYC